MKQPQVNVAQESIVVNAPTAILYEQWLRFEELPKFIKPIRAVQRIDSTHFSFCTRAACAGHDGSLEIVFQKPGRRIAWRSISDGVGLGVVSFEPQPDGSTEVTLKLRSAFNPLLSAESATEYLSNFKRLIESAPAT